MWRTIYKKLKDSGIDVYSMGQYNGECKSPYVVVSNSGSSRDANVSSRAVYYAVMCYVPQNNYSILESFVEEVKEVMKSLFPMIRSDGIETPVTLDEDLKAYMISIEYVNYRKINLW